MSLPIIGGLVDSAKNAVADTVERAMEKHDKSVADHTPHKHTASKEKDTTPLKDRLATMDIAGRKSVVAKSYGSEINTRMGDAVMAKFVETSAETEKLMVKASEDQKNAVESLVATMSRMRRDEKADAGKFRKELLSVLTQINAAGGDEDVKKHLESQVMDALKETQKFRGFRAGIHSFMTKDAEKNNNSWLFRTIAGTDTFKNDVEAARNEGIAQHEVDKISDKLHWKEGDEKDGEKSADKGISKALNDTLGKIENLLRDMMKSQGEAKFPAKIDSLNVDKMVVREKSGRAPEGKKAYPVAPKKDHMPTVVPKQTHHDDITDVDFTETIIPRKPKSAKKIGYKAPLAIGHDAPKKSVLDDAPVKPKYQGKLKTKEKPMAAAVRGALATQSAPAIQRKPTVVDAAKPSVPNFAATNAKASTIFEDSKPVKDDVKPQETKDDANALTNMIPDVGINIGGKGVKGLAKGAGLLKGAGALAAGAVAVDSLTDAYHSYQTGESNKYSRAVDNVGKSVFGWKENETLGGKIYDWMHPAKSETPVVPKKTETAVPKPVVDPKVNTKPNLQSLDVANASAESKAMAQQASTPSAPTIINNSAPAPAPAPQQTPLVSGSVRNRESYFDRVMGKTFSAL